MEDRQRCFGNDFWKYIVGKILDHEDAVAQASAAECFPGYRFAAGRKPHRADRRFSQVI